jgi:hypothetical protein
MHFRDEIDVVVHHFSCFMTASVVSIVSFNFSSSFSSLLRALLDISLRFATERVRLIELTQDGMVKAEPMGIVGVDILKGSAALCIFHKDCGCQESYCSIHKAARGSHHE